MVNGGTEVCTAAQKQNGVRHTTSSRRRRSLCYGLRGVEGVPKAVANEQTQKACLISHQSDCTNDAASIAQALCITILSLSPSLPPNLPFPLPSLVHGGVSWSCTGYYPKCRVCTSQPPSTNGRGFVSKGTQPLVISGYGLLVTSQLNLLCFFWGGGAGRHKGQYSFTTEFPHIARHRSPIVGPTHRDPPPPHEPPQITD